MLCFSKQDMDVLNRQINSKTLSIGVKSLLDVIELSQQTTDTYRVAKFADALEDIGGHHDGGQFEIQFFF
ncbi:unnamed protein product [Brachionus calyciflorus]|uniref:NSF AAA+ ATPase lid domain-containing protein n=1 Tax=Brachionus calyciflorus TaxID=104777 RepID=A0A813NXP9_9BILA|nr:unnamed protein product [Brachionus calyciflorus]